jgi:hypothetical protein
MKFCDFKVLDLPKQAYIVYQKGVYLGERSEGGLFVALYSICNFYVEIYCHFNTGEIVKLIGFHNDLMLEPYLNRISITKWLGQELTIAEQ